MKMNGIEIGRNCNKKIEALVASLGGKRPKGGLEVRALAWAEKKFLEERKSGELYLHKNFKKIIRALISAQEAYIEYCKYSYSVSEEEDQEFWDKEWDAAITRRDYIIDLFCGR